MTQPWYKPISHEAEVLAAPAASNGYRWTIGTPKGPEYLCGPSAPPAGTPVGTRGRITYRITPSMGYWSWSAL